MRCSRQHFCVFGINVPRHVSAREHITGLLGRGLLSHASIDIGLECQRCVLLCTFTRRWLSCCSRCTEPGKLSRHSITPRQCPPACLGKSIVYETPKVRMLASHASPQGLLRCPRASHVCMQHADPFIGFLLVVSQFT